MNYDILINNAISKNEVLKLLRGEKKYEIVVSEFSQDIFPTYINGVLINCFYKQKDNICNIENIFYNSLEQLINGSASDVYIATLYFDACIFQEERNKATFILNKEKFATKLKSAISVHKEELQNSVVFANGMKKINPFRNIQNFNKFYEKYGISII